MQKVLLDWIKQIYQGVRLFQQKKMILVVAACTFFSILCALPLLIVGLDLIGNMFRGEGKFNNFILNQIWTYLPFIDFGLKEKIEALFNSKSISSGANAINFIFLFVSSTGLFRVILLGVHILKERQFDRPLKLYGKGIGAAALLFCFFLFQFFATPLLLSAQEILTKLGKSSIGSFLGIQTYLDSFVFQSWTQIIQLLFFILFFFFILKILFRKETKRSDLCFGTSLMCFLFYIGKTFFYVYITFVRERLVMSYGEFISLIVIILWIYYLFFSFYFTCSVMVARYRLRNS